MIPRSHISIKKSLWDSEESLWEYHREFLLIVQITIPFSQSSMTSEVSFLQASRIFTIFNSLSLYSCLIEMRKKCYQSSSARINFLLLQWHIDLLRISYKIAICSLSFIHLYYFLINKLFYIHKSTKRRDKKSSKTIFATNKNIDNVWNSI